jgi:hypothetical protein
LQLFILNVTGNYTGLLNYKGTELSGRLIEWTFLTRREEREREKEGERTLKSSIGTSSK